MFQGIKNPQKGVSLVITLFIISVTVLIILGMSAVLVGQFKMIREMGKSVIAFHVADSGIEKTYYYDRKIIAEGKQRGVCDICSSCTTDCRDCVLSNISSAPPVPPCDQNACIYCQISFTALFGEQQTPAQVTVEVVPSRDDQYLKTSIKSRGVYESFVGRAIELAFLTRRIIPSAGPLITNIFITQRSAPPGVAFEISADISDPQGVASETVLAHIQNPDENDITTCQLFWQGEGTNAYRGFCPSDGTYLPEGVYFIDITACDIDENCSEAENI